jgi:cation transport protein ChaC
MAAQINRCAGPSGSNRDYVLELARALRGMGYADPHVFEIESRVLAEKDLRSPGPGA